MDSRFRFWTNVLNCKSQNTTLILDSPTEEEKVFIKENPLCKFIFLGSSDIDGNNIIIKPKVFAPGILKHINFCLYRGNEADILFPILSSGISIIKDINKTLNTQEKLERVNNFEAAKEFDKK